MNQTKASWSETPNARLVYKVLKPESTLEELLANSINALVHLEQVVMEETRFQWANSDVLFYFFESPLSPQFEQTPLWVAREVIGPPNEDFAERFALHDTSRTNCFQRPVRPGFFELKMSELKENYTELCRELEAESSGKALPTWRIALDWEGKIPQAQIQLFPE